MNYSTCNVRLLNPTFTTIQQNNDMCPQTKHLVIIINTINISPTRLEP